MIKANLGNLKQQQARIKQIPKYFLDMAMSVCQSNASRMIFNFRDGIIKNNFQIKKLTDDTIAKKKGMPAPNRPLFGWGDVDKKSYMNMLRLRKLKNGYRVFPSWGKHHTSQLPLRVLLEIHEFGKSFVNAGGTITRIPPRPAFRMAYERTLKQKARVSMDMVKRAITGYIREGRTDYFKKVMDIARQDEIKIYNTIGAD